MAVALPVVFVVVLIGALGSRGAAVGGEALGGLQVIHVARDRDMQRGTTTAFRASRWNSSDVLTIIDGAAAAV